MDDIQKLIEEHGLTPVPKTNPQIDSLVNQFGLVPAQTEGGYGVGTFAKDVTKNVAAGAIPGVLGAPEAIQAAANQQVRTSQAIPTDIVNMLANPQALTNKFVESLGFKPIFREEDKTLIPEEMTKKQNMAMDEVLSKGKIPQLKSLSELGNKLGQNISQTVSPEMQLAMANFVPTGSLDDIAHGRLEKISLGAKPSMLGLAGQFSNVFGSVMPGMIGTLVTKDPRYMEAFGFGQAGSEAIGNARQYIQSLDDNQLSNNSPYFQELLRAGYNSKTARMMTEEKAADTAAAAEGVVGMLGGNFTANLITGKFDKALISSVRNRALNIAAKTAKGAVTGATEEGLQEMSEGIASDLGINKTVAKEIGADAFSNLILGAIGGGGPGAVSGLRAKPETAKTEEEKAQEKTILQEGKNVTVEGAPPILPTPKKPATITEEELATEEEVKPPKEESVLPSAKPGFEQWRMEKGITFSSKEDYEAALPRLRQEYEAEMSGAPAAEEPISEKEAKMLKGMEVQKRLTAAAEAKLLTEAEFDKVFKLYDNDKLDAANKQLDKILASKQAPSEVTPTEVTPTEVTPTAEETLAKLKADQAAAEEAKAKREPIEEENLSPAKREQYKYASTARTDNDQYSLKEIQNAVQDSKKNPSDMIVKTEDFLKKYPQSMLQIAAQNGFLSVNEAGSIFAAYDPKTVERYKEGYLDNAEKPIEKKTEPEVSERLKNWLEGKDKFIKDIQKTNGISAEYAQKVYDANIEYIKAHDKAVALQDEAMLTEAIRKKDVFDNKLKGVVEKIKAKAKKEEKPKEKTQTEINKERQAAKKAAAEKAKQPVDTSAVKDLIDGKIKKVLGWTIYKRKEDPEFWYVQSVENHAENKIGPGDDVSTNLDTARARIEQHINDAEYEARKAAEKPAEKKAEPTAPKKGTSLYAAMLLADAKKNGDIDPSYLQGLMYKEMSSNVKDYTAAIEKAIADTKAKKEEKVAKVEEPIKVEKIEPIKEVEGKVSKEYQTALNKSRKASKAFASAQDGYRKRLINDEEFIAARKRYDEAMAEYDVAFAKEQKKPEPKEVKVTPKKTAPVSSEEEQLIQDAVMFAKAANRTNLDEAKIRDTVENARIADPTTVISKLKGSVESLKKQAKDYLISNAARDYNEQIGGTLNKDSDLVNAIKGGALNIESKEYAPAFYRAYNIDPAKIKKPSAGNPVDAQIVKFDSGIFSGRNANPEIYDQAAVKFLESPLTAKMPSKNQEKIDAVPLEGVTPLPIEKKIAVKNKTYEDHKSALSDVTASEDVRYYLKGIYLDKVNNRMMATDGHRGAIINNANFDGAPETTKGKDIVASDNSIIEGQFPDMDRVVPKKHLVKSDIINTKEIGDYARGIQKAWRYIDSRYNPVTMKIGGKELGFNSDYIVDMANLFAKMGYDTFQASADANGKLYATSPDGRVQQVVMAMREPTTPFAQYVPEKVKKLTKEPITIDVEAKEITPSQMKLLTNQISKLSDVDIATLEEHYGIPNYSMDFMKRIREDVITYTNKGAEAINKAIRSIIAKLQAGLLSVAMVFNPAYMSQQEAVVYPTKTVTEEVRATVPDSAKEMSDSGKRAYAALQPALQSNDKLFTIVDKPTSKVFVFNPDGSLLVKDNVVLGMALGDTYVGKTDYKGNRVTPAGLFAVKGEKGSATYDGKTIYTVGNTKEGWNTAFMHTVYLKEADAAARKAALATGEGTRLSHGCVNANPEVMAKLEEGNRMDGSHVFVVPDNQAKIDDYIANNVSNEDLTRETITPVTKTTQVPEKPTKPKLVAREEKAVEQKTQAQINQERQQAKLAAAKVSDEGTFFNNFEADFNKADLDSSILEARAEKISELSSISRRITATTKEVAKEGGNLPIQRRLNYLLDKKQSLKDQIEATKPERRSAEWFRARAAEEVAKENLSPEAMAVVDTLFAKYPSILEGLKLSVRQPTQRGVTGNFRPFERLVTVYHSSLASLFSGQAGERQAVTMRHEIAHSLEQMMTPQAQIALVEAWGKSLDKAIKANPGEAEQDFFQKVLDFVEHPTESNLKRATNAMPDISFYQYVNPSEFWAVNAEKLMKAQLGTPWARFVKAVQKLWEVIKSVFGFDNRYAIHREFDRIMKGDQQQMTQTMLADYLKQNNEEIAFLNNVEDIDDFMDTYDRPDAPLHYSPSVMDRVLGGKKTVKELSRKIKENPMLPVTNMVSNVGRGVLYTRVKNIWFGAGLDEADRRKYEGQLRDSEGHVVASIAVTNALHAGHVGTQVMIQGKLEFDPITQMFRAVKDKFSLANVVRIKHTLENKIGAQRAANLIQAYFEAKRSRSIVNEYLERTKELTSLLEEQMDPTTSDERQLKINKLIADSEEDVKNIQRALDKVNMDDDQIDEAIAFEDEYPELREMMDNWTSVNQNMIDNMEFSGIISKKRAETLRNIKDYVPWYRIQDDATDVHSAQGVRTLTNVGREKTFKEGTTELEIDDIVDNMIHNIMMLTRNSMRNYAANRVAMEYAERNDKGKLQVYPTEDREKGIFNILAGGRRINIKIADPLIAESVLGLENIEIPMGNILRFFANGLRWSVTINPIFQAKQLFMDAPTAALVTGVKSPFKLWAGAFGGFIRGLKPHDPIVDLLKSYGIGGYRSSARSPEHELKQEIGILNKNYFSKAVSILDHISDASDYAQRVAVYKRVLAETDDQMQAIVQANNVIDFQKKGSGKAAQVLTRTVSFMNAYAQQIDVLVQALSGKGLKGLKRQQAYGRLLYTGGLLASVSLLYCMAVGDDDEYQKMDDQTKMRNFVIPKSLTKTIGMDHAVMLPMSTSAAFFFKAVPEMLYNKIVNEGTKNQVDNTRLRTALAKAAADSLLGPTPFPTGLKPFAEIGLNYNFFTGGTITPKGMEKLDPSRQYTNTTSELGKIFSKLSGGTLNPIQADHLMRSLGGTVAATAMWGSNLFSGNRPDAEAKANPLYGSFIAADVPRGREDLFYDLQERADRANETFKDLSKKQHPTEAKQWFEENKQLIIASGFTTGAATSLKSINAEIRRLSDLPAEKMSAEEKRQKITFYKNKKNDILEQTIAFRLKAGL